MAGILQDIPSMGYSYSYSYSYGHIALLQRLVLPANAPFKITVNLAGYIELVIYMRMVLVRNRKDVRS